MANGTLLIAPTRACLEDYFQRYPLDDACELLHRFTHATDLTVRDWSSGRYFPKGEFLLRLRCFLDLVGYRVAEFEDIPQVTRQFARLIAFDIFSMEDARQALDYAQAHDIYRVVLRGQGLVRDKAERLERNVKENLELLDEAATSWQRQIELFKHPVATVELLPLPTQDSPSEEDAEEVEDEHLVRWYDPPAESSPLLTNQVREEAVVDAEVVYHLVCALGALLDNGHEEGLSKLSPLPPERRLAIYNRIGESRLRELIDKLDMLSVFG